MGAMLDNHRPLAAATSIALDNCLFWFLSRPGPRSERNNDENKKRRLGIRLEEGRRIGFVSWSNAGRGGQAAMTSQIGPNNQDKGRWELRIGTCSRWTRAGDTDFSEVGIIKMVSGSKSSHERGGFGG